MASRYSTLLRINNAQQSVLADAIRQLMQRSDMQRRFVVRVIDFYTINERIWAADCVYDLCASQSLSSHDDWQSRREFQGIKYGQLSTWHEFATTFYFLFYIWFSACVIFFRLIFRVSHRLRLIKSNVWWQHEILVRHDSIVGRRFVFCKRPLLLIHLRALFFASRSSFISQIWKSPAERSHPFNRRPFLIHTDSFAFFASSCSLPPQIQFNPFHLRFCFRYWTSYLQLAECAISLYRYDKSAKRSLLL